MAKIGFRVKLDMLGAATVAASLLALHLLSGGGDQAAQPEQQDADSGYKEFCVQEGDTVLACYGSIGELIEALDNLPSAPSLKPEEAARPATGLTEYYNMGGKTFSVSPDVQSAFRRAEADFGIPYQAMVAVCGRESDCVADNINPSSEACGLFQFMTNNTQTLYEVAWKYGAENGYAEAASHVERYVRRTDNAGRPHYGYRPINASARTELIELCKDPDFNATMWAAYQTPHIDAYNDWLGNRTITTGEVVAMNNLGRVGLQAFARQAWADSADGDDMLAVDFFRAKRRLFGGDMSSNRTLVRHPNGNYKTVREAYNEMFSFGGYESITPSGTMALSQ